MSDDDETLTDPPTEPDEDEEEWNRLSPRLRGLIREELEEHSKRQTPAPEPVKPPAQEKPPAPTTEPETPKNDDRSTAPRPRRSAAHRWFGLHRTV